MFLFFLFRLKFFIHIKLMFYLNLLFFSSTTIPLLYVQYITWYIGPRGVLHKERNLVCYCMCPYISVCTYHLWCIRTVLTIHHCTHYTTIHYTTLHYTILHCCEGMCNISHYTTLYYNTLYYTAVRVCATSVTVLHYTALHSQHHQEHIYCILMTLLWSVHDPG